MTSRRNNDRGVDGVGIHARLIIVVHRNQRPVGNNASNPYTDIIAALPSGDQILDRGSIEKLDVIQRQHLAQQRTGEERSVLDHHESPLVLVRDAEPVEEQMCRLAHDHGGEQLTAQPGPAARRDSGLDQGHAQVRPGRGEVKCRREAAGAGADDDDVRLGVGMQVGKVARGHGPRHLRLADRGEAELVPVRGQVVQLGRSCCGGGGIVLMLAVLDVQGLDRRDDGGGGGGGSHAWFRLFGIGRKTVNG